MIIITIYEPDYYNMVIANNDPVLNNQEFPYIFYQKYPTVQ